MTLDFPFTAHNWWGQAGIFNRLEEHLWFTLAAMAIALLIALPIGIAAGHTGRFGFLAVNVSNIGRAVPSVAFLGLASELIPGGFDSPFPTIIALVVLALPPIITNTYVGMRQAEPDAVEAARGMGMSAPQVALRVEFPLAIPLAMGAIRTSTVNVVATVTLAALVGQGGLGRFIIDGQATSDIAQMVAGSVLVALLAILADLLLGGLTRRFAAIERSRRATSSVTPVEDDELPPAAVPTEVVPAG